MRVIVGLGNPGGEYERTRHNIGWLAVEALARRLEAGRFRRERLVEVAEGRAAGEKIYLLKPQSYMNCSGQALASWLGTFREVREEIRLRPEREAAAPGGREDGSSGGCDWPGLLVVADDVNLPLGRLRLRPDGSAGGHNGLKDIEKTLGGRSYPRLRLGVGAPPGRVDRADYVLGRFSGEEMPLAERLAEDAAAVAGDWISLGMDAARDRHNGPVREPAAGG